MARRDQHNPTIRQRGLGIAAALALALPVAALAQTVQLVNQPFPVTTIGQTTSLSLTLNIGNQGTVALSAQVAPGYTEFSVAGISGCNNPSGAQAAGTQCQININFSPQLPGQAASPVPIGRSAVLNIGYSDTATSQYVQQSFMLTGSATGPYPMLSPGIVSDIAGNDILALAPGFGGDGGPAGDAVFANPGAIVTDVLGNIYIADSGNNVVRAVYKAGTLPNVSNPTVGNIYTIAGIAPAGASTAGPGTDGVPATQSALNNPLGLALDQLGNVYIADSGNNAVRMVNATTGIITTVAGSLNAPAGYSGDAGAATAALLSGPGGISIDGSANLYIADTNNNAVRMMKAATGIITTVAGGANPPATGNGDGGPATAANLNLPVGVITDSAGDIYIADSQDFALRRVDGVTGNISTVSQGTTPVTAVSVDTADDIYFTQASLCTVSQYSPTTQSSQVFAGSGSCTTSGDGGPATQAGLLNPRAIAMNAAGGLYVLQQDSIRYVDGSQTAMNFGSVAAGSTAGPLSATVTDIDIVNPANPTNPPWAAMPLNVYAGSYSFLNTQQIGPGGTIVLGPFYDVPYVGTTTATPDCAANLQYQSISAGQSCGFSVDAQPVNSGISSLAEPLAYNSLYLPSATVNLSVAGTGSFNQLQTLPSSIAFGNVFYTSNTYNPVTQDLYLNNPTASPIQVTGITVDNLYFTLGNTSCGTISAHSFCVVPISFAPVPTVPTYAGHIQITASDPGSPHVVPITGAYHPTATVEVIPATVNYGSVQIGTISLAEPATLYNFTSAPITVVSITPFAQAFVGTMTVLVDGCTGTTLAPNASCSITTDFTPANDGPLSGYATIAYTTGGQISYLAMNFQATGTGPVPLNIHETITTSDAQPVLTPSTPLSINETITTSDGANGGPFLTPSTLLPINETITTSDGANGGPFLTPSTLLPINETIVTSDVSVFPTTGNAVDKVLLVASVTAVNVGGNLTLTATVKPASGTVSPTGTVTFYDNGSALTGVSVAGGVAAYSTSNLAAGAHSLFAQYSGDATYESNKSSSLTVTVTTNTILNVIAQNASRNFDVANPAFAYNVTGFTGGDTAAVLSGTPSLSTTATLNSPAGTYPITASQGTLSGPPYYTFNFIPASLTVNSNATQTITFAAFPASIPESIGKLTLTAHSTSGLAISYQVSGPATISGTTLTLTGTGTVTVTASQGGNSTFAAATPVTRSFEAK